MKIAGNDESKLVFTGERLTPEINEYWSIEHLHRYALVLNLIPGKKVLDIASGEGYGTYLMAELASEIVGVDISEVAVKHAGEKYRKTNLSFLHGGATKIPLDDHSIDVITSFETIEHLEEHDKMIQEIQRVLKPGGLLIISSPDKKYYSDIPNYQNPYHVRELYSTEFKELLDKYFKRVLMVNQKTIFGSFISSANTIDNEFIEFSGDYSNITASRAIEYPVYNICFCTNNMNGNFSIIEHSVFCSDDIFKMYIGLKEENRRLHIENKKLTRKLNGPIQKVLTVIKMPFKIARKFILLGK